MVLATSKLTGQGQVSVPVEVRKVLGVAAGSVIEWEEKDGAFIVRRSYRKAMARWVGLVTTTSALRTSWSILRWV